MNGAIAAVVTGVTAFAATNVDDILVLMVLFAKANATNHLTNGNPGEPLQRRHIVVGQYLGFAVLILLSLPGFFGGLLIPKVWLGWLGLLPIAIGLNHLWHPSEEDEIQVVHEAEGAIAAPIAPRLQRLASVLSPHTYQVAAVTLANGGDNIGIYVPLFASSSLADLAIILTSFLILIAVWCAIALYLSSHPLLAKPLTRYGHRLVPVVLIGLGLFIVFESGAWRSLIP